jgi:hypothetical protein
MEVITMKIYTEQSLRDFDFWSGAADTRQYLTDDEMDTIESILEDLYPNGMDETDINDLFWFEADMIAEWLGYNSFEDIMNSFEDIMNEEEEEEEEEE